MYQREGPLPRPEELQAYFDISVHVGDTIVQMAKDAADHRHRMESRGSWLAAVMMSCVTLVLLAVVGAAAYIASEEALWGGVILGSSPVGLIIWIIRTRRRRVQSKDD